MVRFAKGTLALSAALLMATTAMAQDKRVVTWNADYDPIPLAAAEALIADFEAANPEIDVQLTNFDHEAYKNAIRNFLTADAPDLANWYAANRMRPFVEAGLFADISDVWADNGLTDALASSVPSSTIDGKQYAVPYTYYQWGIYYNRDAYKAAGVDLPGDGGVTWDQFLANCEKFKAAGIDCVTTGSSALWPVAGIFDYISLRTNGYQFHSDLAAGKVSWTSPEARAVFDNLGKLQPYVTANHAAIDWQDAAALFVQGKAANYVMGNFAVGVFKEGGMTNDNLGFMVFPEITAGVARAEEAPTDTVHLTSGAKNPDDAKKLLAFIASADAQSKWNGAVGQLPTNKNSTVDAADPFLTAGFQALSTATGGIAQFWDRDADAEYAKAGMEGFQQFLVQPEKLDEILERLEQTRLRIYPQ
ncbi:sugar ABC transporter substrate-binding protein [Gemmobacter aquarius]|uniref:Probable sugar-binding periplasmic protein n=1 Tax=Paragemmobacter aquarius TaxID=2169400 RepID=A0A2S0UHR0_9RHOB|nr:extracellular solute-binding protein [Gemmobacter aquarius]AWB47270.1 sugar ABC transporter substrate-binding protein [Gemmobacter aquarius]